jgi:hypothetical protein
MMEAIGVCEGAEVNIFSPLSRLAPRVATRCTLSLRSDRRSLIAFLTSGLLFVLFLLDAFGPLGTDKPLPSELALHIGRAEELAEA